MKAAHFNLVAYAIDFAVTIKSKEERAFQMMFYEAYTSLKTLLLPRFSLYLFQVTKGSLEPKVV